MKRYSITDWIFNREKENILGGGPFRSYGGNLNKKLNTTGPGVKYEIDNYISDLVVTPVTTVEPGDGTTRSNSIIINEDISVVSIDFFGGILSPGITSGIIYQQLLMNFDSLPFITEYWVYNYSSGAGTGTGQIDTKRNRTLPGNGKLINSGTKLTFSRSCFPVVGAGNWQPWCHIHYRKIYTVIVNPQ